MEEEKNKEKTMYDFNVEIQFQYDRRNFTNWCYNLFELNERLYLEFKLTHKSLLLNEDFYLKRFYFVTLWELLYNGSRYIERQNDKDEKHLVIIKQLLCQILEECSDDDYFMIQYFRNCASHIFLSRYSPLNEKGNAKKEDYEVPFYKKNGNVYKLTYAGILQKVEQVYGGKIGESLELKYKRELIERLYPIIHEVFFQIQEMEEKDTHEFIKAICPIIVE